jgi:hypothetical protein
MLVAAIALASLLPVAAAPQAAAPAAAPAAQATSTPHKALAPAGLLDSAASGVVLWHDYGSFGLYKLSDAALAGLPAAVRSQIQVDPQMDVILFDRHPLDTAAGDANLPALLASKAPAGPALHLVQFVGPIQGRLAGCRAGHRRPVGAVHRQQRLSGLGRRGQPRPVGRARG